MQTSPFLKSSSATSTWFLANDVACQEDLQKVIAQIGVLVASQHDATYIVTQDAKAPGKTLVVPHFVVFLV